MAAKLSLQVLGAFLMFLVLQPFLATSRPLKLESLQNLEGALKGDTVIGLNQVKQYLKAFGYYPNDIDLIDDHFDESLMSALEAFLEIFHLKVTGKIDPDTIKTMLTPRCGVPDVICNQTSSGTKGTHGHNPGIFHLVANYSFFPGSPIWSRFQEVSQGNQADIGNGFYRYDHGDGYPFDGPGNVLAHAFAPEDGRFHYDADENWSSNPTSPDQLDLESVAVHEIGHNLGLDHSWDQNAIMYPTIPLGTNKRNLGQDDINGLQALYGY